MLGEKTVEILHEGIGDSWEDAKAKAGRVKKILSKTTNQKLKVFYEENGIYQVNFYVVCPKN